ncbi:MAG TPA: 2Fe-2S iron-sulfur cluster-binding protein [Alphaproteobacteria bacterium]|nr:2Fe-2S iron-sulfur cluster-binding protein [Alphaproteobacteria bacterium]
MKQIFLTVNGRRVEAAVEPRLSLADFLRNHLRLTGTHLGCEHGVCGACTILLDGAPARSCIAYAVACDGAEVRTVEGFGDDAVMGKLREAFHLDHALQCGFCTPGMLITARDIVTRLANPDERRIRTELAGNLCRCTGYMGIVNAIQRVIHEVPAAARLGRAAIETVAAAPAAAVATASTAPPVAAEPAPTPRFAPPLAPATAGSGPEKGWSRLVDSFTVDMPPGDAWKLFADIDRLARCLPGAELAETNGRDLKGAMRVAFGPIKASFAGTGTIERDDAQMSGTLSGGGSDTRSGSRAKGLIRYRLFPLEEGRQTRVELVLDYQIQGAFAQFSRGGLVKDFAGRLIAEFARNLAGIRPSGPEAPPPPRAAELKAGALIWQVLWGRIRRWLGF